MPLELIQKEESMNSVIITAIICMTIVIISFNGNKRRKE